MQRTKNSKKIWLSTPTMHGNEMPYIQEAFDKNWVAPLGFNVDSFENEAAEYLGEGVYTLALNAGTAALHLAIKLAGVKPGDVVLCTDMTFAATVNPVTYEGAKPVFVDAERETWNMDPRALEAAFEKYPDAKVVMLAHLYGTPAKMDDIVEICKKHNAILIEDAAEAFAAEYKGQKMGTFGKYAVLSFNGNKIITTSGGGMLITDTEEAKKKAFFWATQARDAAPWYQHSEIGYNYRMSNVVAGIGRGQMAYLDEHRDIKEKIYRRYEEGFKGLPISMNPFDEENSEPNYWLSCMIIDKAAMCKQVRGECEALYIPEHGKSCPTEILDILTMHNAEGRPVWKPMHMQPIYRMNGFVTREGDGRAKTNAYISGGSVGKDGRPLDVGMDIFHRGLCLPSDNKMTVEQQNQIIDMIKACFE